MSRPVTRRQFLAQSSCASVGSLGLLSTLLNLRMAGSALAQGGPPAGEDRALVCLFFAGGIDSYNLLMPVSGSSVYNNYVTTRGGLYDAVNNADGLAINGLPLAAHATDPFGFGVHPKCGDHNALPGMQSLYASGNLAFVSNVGTLVERTDKEKYNAGLARPRGLYSHSDQVRQWHTSVTTQTGALGWAGTAADLLHAGNQNAKVSMNISLGGNNVWQTGNKLFAYSVGTSGSTLPSDYNSPYENPTVSATSRSAIRTAAIDNLVQQEHQNLLDQTFTQNLKDSIEASAAFRDAFNDNPITTPFPGDAAYVYPPGFTSSNDPARTLGQQFKAVVRSIKARQTLGLRRQTFFVNYGGWDHHDEVINTMDRMIDVVNRCLIAYWQALGEIGMQEQVTLYTASDFARTLTSNGAGSDHAWGGNMFVLGGAVNGGRVYGTYPDVALNAPSVVTSRGATLPGISVDEYFAELALWLGVTPGDLSSVLPRVTTFYSPGGAAPVGFMQA
ncbi:MAG: DUF1501 domain-containing protein [Akkermansiaceae bacterium]|jgi:uncharacterized protein (DUF1501 family)|nr:DUF1501 domain-containing protein [Akkermansiaceae bacterium]